MVKGKISREKVMKVLGLIILGIDFPGPGKTLAVSFFEELKLLAREDGETLDQEQFENILRQIDALILELGVSHLLLKKIQEELDPKVRKNYQDRRIERRRPAEELHIRLVSK